VIQSPCLQRFPVSSRGSASKELTESNYQPRYVEMLTDPEVIETMKTRATIVKVMRRFFEKYGFMEVSTPILTAQAGGATARPFETQAVEFADRKLSLRIAPELWLKRLVIGGLDKVFEIGPSFRNEGLDKTHNPEFTTCEFYAVSHDLDQLISMTNQLFGELGISFQRQPNLAQDFDVFKCLQAGIKTIDYIPALNAALDLVLPNLSSPSAHSMLFSIFKAKNIPLPAKPTIPRLLDELCSIYLEPKPDDHQLVWIKNIPECLSPLAKSFIHPTAPNQQSVAARAELFIMGKEIVNCYEEENSPFEQRRKFVDQQRYASETGVSSTLAVKDEEAMKVDEEYLQALEWGLPPTGGWGCGIDRLVMLFAGKDRIGDVLSFGNLRAVTRGAERVDR
jgi:lysyl-tRNA synthetase, class II